MPPGPAAPAGGAAAQAGQQGQQGELASLWGNAQVGTGEGGPGCERALLLHPCHRSCDPAAVLALLALGAALPPHHLIPASRLQGDRNDPFGSFLSSLRLGTGF